MLKSFIYTPSTSYLTLKIGESLTLESVIFDTASTIIAAADTATLILKSCTIDAVISFTGKYLTI